MLQSYDIPECIVNAWVRKGALTGAADYHLAGSGRAIAFVRMAADALEKLDNAQRVAEYHAYCGISAARTAIDAAASWLRLSLKVSVRSPLYVDMKKQAFRRKVIDKVPQLERQADTLGELAEAIDEHRQRAQHREGLAMIFHEPGKQVVHLGGWYLAPKGLSAQRDCDVYLAELLREWAGGIEDAVCSMITVVER